MFKFVCVALLQVIFINIATAQLKLTSLQFVPNPNNAAYSQSVASQQPQSYNIVPVDDRTGTVASVGQRPPNVNARITKRQYIAEALKQSALESLLNAASLCNCPMCDKALPKRQLASDVMTKRVVKMQYL